MGRSLCTMQKETPEFSPAARAGARSLVLLLTLAGGISFAVMHFDGWFRPVSHAPIVAQTVSAPSYSTAAQPVITIGFDANGQPQVAVESAADSIQPLRANLE